MATEISIEVARGLQLKGLVAEAERLYREQLGQTAGFRWAHFLEGLGLSCSINKGVRKRRPSLFAPRGVAIEPQSVRFQANLGEALRTTRRFDQALDHLRKAVALDPADVQAWNSLGMLSFDVRRYPAALHAYREAIRLRPRFVHAYINLANTLLAMGQPAEAAD